MDFKDVKQLTNTEISLYKKELENEYETIKTKINKLCDELEQLDKEYVKVENEVGVRKNRLF